MRHRISMKIFVVLMTAFLIILMISMNLNISAQKNLYCQWITERYNYTEKLNKVIDLFKEYKIFNVKDKEKILRVIKEETFQEKLQHISDGYQNYIFISYIDNYQNVIAEYTLGEKYLDDYLVLYHNDNQKMRQFQSVLYQKMISNNFYHY